MEFSSPAPSDVFSMSAPPTLAPACGGGRVAAMKQLLLMIAVVALVGCGKQEPKAKAAAEAKATAEAKAELEDFRKELALREEQFYDEMRALSKADNVEVEPHRLSEAEGLAGHSLLLGRDVRGPAPFSYDHQLTSLNLSYTDITDLGLKQVAKLQKLTSLDLSSNKITDAGLKEVAKLQKLTSLDLSATKITDAGLKEVAKLQQLTELLLVYTDITDAGLKELAKLRHLTYLDLSCYDQITDTGVAQLQKALPKCKIYSNPHIHP
jgi:Leucine-rich repeat (LRR) protein